jgi:hypothetical protein
MIVTLQKVSDRWDCGHENKMEQPTTFGKLCGISQGIERERGSQVKMASSNE